MAYVTTGMGALPFGLKKARQTMKDIGAISRAAPEEKQAVAARLATAAGRTPITREQITEPYAVRSVVPPRSAPPAPAPAVPAAPAVQVPIPEQPMLELQPLEEDYTWYYVGGGIALLGIGIAAYFYLR